MIKIRKYSDTDLDWLVKLNNLCVPNVDPHTNASMQNNLNHTRHTIIAIKDGVALGAALLMREGEKYNSKNYNWHSAHNSKHLYVDRIIVAEQARGMGVGRKLYQHAFGLADDMHVPLTAEVNTVPDNPQSHAFHHALGFDIAGETEHEPGYSVRFYKYEGQA
ncbi:MAG: GNAT family N-acetyltransferase [Rhizobiales bacterium]|nr:GNAT family N-acetyltransferase [Hyphomicrobiales bacterium]NRB14988.1 GNAT family N-acetyltransferase [Hyphomicrobiales bacterium]